jgi:hypothetical protein
MHRIRIIIFQNIGDACKVKRLSLCAQYFLDNGDLGLHGLLLIGSGIIGGKHCK